MPEGHTIHRLARDHQLWFVGQAVRLTSPQGRFAKEALRISGKALLAAEAFGKHLLYQFEDDLWLHVHLGLYGRFRLHRNPPPDPRGAVRLRMLGEERCFDLNGPNQCELYTTAECRQLQQRLGPDPLRSDAAPERAWERIRRSKSAIGILLLRQDVIAGLGNIYRAEILHILGIHPDRPGKHLTRQEFDQIWQLSCELLRVGVRYNRIITSVDRTCERSPSRLRSGERLLIYKKPVCPRCHQRVYCWNLGNRTIYACESCQY